MKVSKPRKSDRAVVADWEASLRADPAVIAARLPRKEAHKPEQVHGNGPGKSFTHAELIQIRDQLKGELDAVEVILELRDLKYNLDSRMAVWTEEMRRRHEGLVPDQLIPIGVRDEVCDCGHGRAHHACTGDWPGGEKCKCQGFNR